jgi:hypothetical protein
MVEYLEQLTTEWYEYRGYFVHRDLWVGLASDGSYECELDVVAFHPTRHHLVHIEPSLDLLSWKDREQHFQLKFDAGKKYLHRMFGAEPHLQIEQIALIVSGDELPRHSIAGGKIVRLPDLLADILKALSRFDMSESLVPDQWPLIRTLQFVAAYRDQLVPVLVKSSDRSVGEGPAAHDSPSAR